MDIAMLVEFTFSGVFVPTILGPRVVAGRSPPPALRVGGRRARQVSSGSARTPGRAIFAAPCGRGRCDRGIAGRGMPTSRRLSFREVNLSR